MKTVEDLKITIVNHFKGYQLAFEVPSSVGYARKRRADCLAFHASKSDPLTIVGMEFKISRQDWLYEMSNPAKSGKIKQYCDFWYLVTGNDGVAFIDEVPEDWGWLELTNSGKFILRKPATRNHAVEEPPRTFLASIIKRLYSGSSLNHSAEILDAIKQQATEEAVSRLENEYKRNIALLTKQCRTLQDTIKIFEIVSGLPLDQRTAALAANYAKIGKEVENKNKNKDLTRT